MVIYIPYNFSIGLYISAISVFILATVFVIQFYYSRFHARMHNSTLFGLAGIIIFSVNYFTNSGINGSTDLIWPSYLLLVLSISPYRQQLTWLLVYLIVFFTLHSIEYLYPQLVTHAFNTPKLQFIDRVTSFPMPALAIYIMIRFIRQSYDKARITAEQRAQAVEIRNHQILLQKNELEQSNAEKNKLMSIISHDLRAPLVNIQNYLELLNENAVDNTQRINLEQNLLTATNHTMQMLSNLLYWSKNQMDGQNIHLHRVNLLQTLQSTLEMEQMQASKKDIRFHYDVEEKLDVMADADMLQLVVRNLVSNAIKFTATGGAINVLAKTADKHVKITISDNGIGIDLNKQATLFSADTEVTYGTNNEKGAGLGLLLCKEFIERQNGKITFESTPGIGSNFYIYIPAAI